MCPISFYTGILTIRVKVMVKVLRNRPEGPEGRRDIALTFLDLGARTGCVVSTTPRPLYPVKDPVPIVQEAEWAPRAGLDRCEKYRPHRDFFLSCALWFRYWTFNGHLYRIVLHAVNFSSRKNPTASVGSEPAILGTRGQHANP
jgi:hypothetical protein